MRFVRSARLAAATALVAAAGTVVPGSPAAAATCASGTGVSVVVDGTGLGGGIAASCVAEGGGDTAASLFEVHHDLTRTAQFPGAVCKVDGAPAEAQCQGMPPADAYWGLFWSDGSGGWVYSSEGVDSLNVPDGGSVAFAWQDGGSQDPPGTAPPQTQAEPSASPTPSSGGGGTGPGSGPGSGGAGGGDAPATAPSAASSGPTSAASGGTTGSAEQTGRTRSGERDRRGDDTGRPERKRDRVADRAREERDGPAASADASVTADPVTTADPPAATADGLPGWVAPTGIAGLFAIAGVVAMLRRRAVV